MADVTEKLGATIVLIVIFMSLFIILLGNIPPEMIVAQPKQFYQYGYEESWTPNELGAEDFAYYLEHNVTYAPFAPVTYDFGPENLTLVLRVQFGNAGAYHAIHIEHLYWYWGPFFYFDDMKVVNDTGTIDDSIVYESDAVYVWADNKAQFYPVFCSHKTGITLVIKDTNSSRNDISAAWAEGVLEIGLGMGYYIEPQPVAMNGWALIASLLSFQAPTIFGMTGLAATVLNMVIALTLWSMICYLVYRLVLMAIPFVGG